MNICLLLVVLNTENYSVRKCKHEFVTFTLYTFILNVANLHNLKTTGVFKLSSYGNFVTTLFCMLNLGKKLP